MNSFLEKADVDWMFVSDYFDHHNCTPGKICLNPDYCHLQCKTVIFYQNQTKCQTVFYKLTSH